MLAEIITIGDEILIGQIVDTNSAFISKELNKVGIEIYQITSIKDDRAHILEALEHAQKNVDLVLITGGLGPTTDDITKETICDYFEDTLVEDKEVLDHINYLFQKYFKRKPLADNLLQAMVPSKATILKNPHGTAPGMWLEKDRTVFVSMPGVPYEMKYLIKDEVLPRVIERFHRPFIYHKTLLTYGRGESDIANTIKTWQRELPKYMNLAYLPSLGKVRLRLSSKGNEQKALKNAVDQQMNILFELLSDVAIGFEEETSIGERIGSLLVEKHQSLSLAESCTGGAIASEITAKAGASSFFKGSVITYATEIKASVLGVDPELIEKFNVVSIQVAESMAIRSKTVFATDYAIATTGIAGPSKGDGDDEVGTVCIAIATPYKVVSEKFNFGKARERVITKSTNKALEMLLKEILKN